MYTSKQKNHTNTHKKDEGNSEQNLNILKKGSQNRCKSYINWFSVVIALFLP